jgi:hypothetical protein
MARKIEAAANENVTAPNTTRNGQVNSFTQRGRKLQEVLYT